MLNYKNENVQRMKTSLNSNKEYSWKKPVKWAVYSSCPNAMKKNLLLGLHHVHRINCVCDTSLCQDVNSAEQQMVCRATKSTSIDNTQVAGVVGSVTVHKLWWHRVLPFSPQQVT